MTVFAVTEWLAASTVWKPPSVGIPGRFGSGCGNAPPAGGMLNGEPRDMGKGDAVQLAPAIVVLVG